MGWAVLEQERIWASYWLCYCRCPLRRYQGRLLKDSQYGFWHLEVRLGVMDRSETCLLQKAWEEETSCGGLPGLGDLRGKGESKGWILRPGILIEEGGLGLRGGLADPSRIDSFFITLRTSAALGRLAGLISSSLFNSW